MPKIVTPMDHYANALQFYCVMAEAQAVIGMRLLGAMGVWSVPKSENTRMLNEKIFAFLKGTTDASLAAISGATPDIVTAAAIKPIRKTTRANHRRLTRRGIRRR